MNFRTVDEFEKFNFDEAHISGIEIKSGHVFLYLDNVIEGVKVYNADGVFQREIPDEIIPVDKYQETFDLLADKYMLEATVKRDEIAGENVYEFEIEYEEFSYLLVVKANHDTQEWDRFMNKE